MSQSDLEDSSTMAPALELASLLTSGDLEAVATMLTAEATLWAASRALMEPSLGRREVTATLGRLAKHRAPTRIRVLRNGMSSAVLAAYAGEDALWSLEVAIVPPLIDCVMLWMPLEAHGVVFGAITRVDE